MALKGAQQQLHVPTEKAEREGRAEETAAADDSAEQAEKAAEVEVLEVVAFGAFGRVFLGGTEANIQEAAAAVENALAAVTGVTEARV